jgi:Eukaryotic aspartyl protease
VDIVGDYFTDSFGIGGAQLKGLQMGLALDSPNSTLYYGILGLGRAADEASTITKDGTLIQNKTIYPNFMDQLVSQSFISSKTYSFYFNDLASTSGSIVFGGIDTHKFNGTLEVVASTNDTVDMSRIAILDSRGATVILINSTESAESGLTAVFQTSSLLIWVPASVLAGTISYFGAFDDRNSSGLVFVDCEKLTSDAGTLFEFTFGRSFGPTINVPISEMILPLHYFLEPQAAVPKTTFASTCVLGMTANDAAESFAVLGNTFLRSAYAVFDLDHSQVALAQSVYGVTGSNIVEIPASATGIPLLSGSAPSSTSTSTSGSNTGGGAPGTSKPKSISAGAIAGIVISILIALCVIGFLAFVFLRRRRGAHRAPVDETETPPTINTHEVPGKDHEVEPKEMETNALEVLGKDHDVEQSVTENSTREIPGEDYEAEKNELPTHNNKHELAEGGVGDIRTFLPHEVENEAQQSKHELSGSVEDLAEAPSATYSPAGELDSYGAISPDQFAVASVPELAAEPIARKPISTQSPVSHISSSSISESILPSQSTSETAGASRPEARTSSSVPSRLEILQERIERVRAEKERLAKVQELEEMELALKQEIMEELRRKHSSE